MGQEAFEFFRRIGAVAKRTRAIAVTNVSANVDLTTLAEFKGAVSGVTPAYDHTNRVLRLRPTTADVYYYFYTDGSLTIDDTNTTAGNSSQADVIPVGQYIDVCIPYIRNAGVLALASFLYFKTSAGTATLRVTVMSEDPGIRTSAS